MELKVSVCRQGEGGSKFQFCSQGEGSAKTRQTCTGGQRPTPNAEHPMATFRRPTALSCLLLCVGGIVNTIFYYLGLPIVLWMAFSYRLLMDHLTVYHLHDIEYLIPYGPVLPTLWLL